MRLILIYSVLRLSESNYFDFKNTFAQADIISVEPLFIEITRDFRIYGVQHDVVLRLKKILYGESKAACLW